MQVNLDKLQLGPRIQTIREIKLHQYQTETFFHPVDGAENDAFCEFTE